MIAAAKAARVPVLLATPTLDAGCGPTGTDATLDAHAQLIRDLAAEHGLGLVDSHAAFLAYQRAGGRLGDLLSQGNHPGRRGHALVADLVIDWLPT
jgi:lysophospholipase L1-like esterase